MEKRKYPHVYLDMPLQYRVTNAPRVHGALVVNASKGGPLVHSIKDLPIRTKLNIAVMVAQGFELANFQVFAEVV